MNRLGLKGTLLLGIFVPILIAFLIIAGLLFVNVGPLVSIRALGSNSLKELGDLPASENPSLPSTSWERRSSRKKPRGWPGRLKSTSKHIRA